MRTLRYQLLQSTIDRPTYIPPIVSEFDYHPDVKQDETLITDDPHYIVMGWLSEIGKSSLIKLTNDHVMGLYRHMHGIIYPVWEHYVENGRKGYKLGLVATVDFPGVLRNYDWSRLAAPILESIENGIATIVFESGQGAGAIAKHSRIRKSIYKVRELKIDSNGAPISDITYYAYKDNNNAYVKIDKPAFY